MKIRFTDRAWMERFGLEVDWPEDRARKALTDKIAIEVNPVPKRVNLSGDPEPQEDSFEIFLREGQIRKVPVRKSRRWYETRFLKVAWVADAPGRPWGAENSNARVIDVGRKIGIEILEISQKNFVDASMLDQADVAVLNNLFMFGEKQFTVLVDRLFSGDLPYVRYEHDFGFCSYRQPGYCMGEMNGEGLLCYGCMSKLTPQNFRQVEIYRRLFQRSRLNVFISPMHRDIHARAMGAKNIEPCHILTPPVDVEMFRPPGENGKRDKNLVISTVGKLYGPSDKKGWRNIKRWINENPQYRYELYTGLSPAIEEWKRGNHYNVQIIEPVPLEDLVGVYQRAGKCLFLPRFPDAAGRTVIEAALCGCEPVFNDMVGVGSFPKETLDLEDSELLRGQIERGPYQFWRAVEKVI